MDVHPAKTIDQGKEEVAKLCRYFTTNRQAFLAPGVKEAHVRQSLIDPLFEALGWDVGNKAMTAPQYREVIPEDSLDVEGQQKAPDYTFRVGSLRKFYAEAKKCGVNIGTDSAPAFQLRRYGWSAKLALSILTDFEELSVYDCTLRPRPSEKASHARIQYLHFEEYPDRWRELWEVFSREAVWSGAFDQYAASKRKRGTSEVDVEFLKEMENWRLALAGNIALRNKKLSLDDLNAAVQLTIDRVVFLRMAEDRGLEPYEQLLKLCERPDIYARFMHDLSRRADQKYNSGLFHFQKESGVSEEPDRITPKLAVDDKVFKPILQSLYFAHGSPYQFGVMPVEILGTVYERFLGKVIRLTAGHQAKIEEKPEVRKAGGVYYTPAYIVEYIVKQTVSRQVEGRSPAQLAGSNDKPTFRILDMACGSGSFLLGAYRHLLDYCLNWYTEHKPENHKKAVYKDPRKGHWRLRIEEKKRILTTHVFGVDIDPQAVEVTKLSLLLKVLEGETDQSLSLSQLAFGDRALPNLTDNIKCGNSLIAPDYFTGKLFADPEEMKRVNPFDWKQGFPNAMKAGGFDCIIGNPPYIFTRNQGISPSEKEYFYDAYHHQSVQLNTFGLFLERSTALSNMGSSLGFITPNNWLTIDTFAPLRKFILGAGCEVQVANVLARVFREANVDSAILLINKGTPPSVKIAEIIEGAETFSKKLPISAFEPPGYILQISLFKDTEGRKVLRKIEAHSQPLGRFCTVSTGLKAYQTGKGKPRQTNKEKRTRAFHSTRKLDRTYARYLDGVDVCRYALGWSGEYLNYGDWLAEPRRSVPFSGERLLVRQIPSKPPYLVQASLATQLAYNDINSMVVFAPLNPNSLKYLLGLINCRLLSFWFSKKFDKLQRKIFPQFKVKELATFPICPMNFSQPSEKTQHDRMEKLVDSMLALHKQLAAAKSGAQKAILQRQIEATDRQIDQLVYQLYGLTDQEIALIENSTSEPKTAMSEAGS